MSKIFYLYLSSSPAFLNRNALTSDPAKRSQDAARTESTGGFRNGPPRPPPDTGTSRPGNGPRSGTRGRTAPGHSGDSRCPPGFPLKPPTGRWSSGGPLCPSVRSARTSSLRSGCSACIPGNRGLSHCKCLVFLFVFM